MVELSGPIWKGGEPVPEICPCYAFCIRPPDDKVASFVMLVEEHDRVLIDFRVKVVAPPAKVNSGKAFTYNTFIVAHFFFTGRSLPSILATVPTNPKCLGALL